MSARRRQLMRRGMAIALAAAAPAVWAQSPKPDARLSGRSARLADQFRILIPANPGGGWDQTGRALGAALVNAGVVGQVTYENVGGKGGTLGLARFAEKYSADPNAMLIGGVVMVGAVALQKPAVDLAHVRPLARLTSDYLVVAVPASSPIKTAKDMVAAMRANLTAVPIAGGSAGGVDHVFAGILARAAKAPPANLVYKPFAGGAEVVGALLDGSAAAGISGFSEFSDALASGKLRAIGISARRTAFGLPTFREQGLDAEMANWRGVFTGRDVTPERQAAMIAALEQATLHESWLRTLKENRWDASWTSGAAFADFLELNLTTARVMVYLLQLKA